MKRATFALAVILVLSSVCFSQAWTYPIEVYSGGGDRIRTLYFGVDYRADECFNDGLDVPYIPVPSGVGAYFVTSLADCAPPGMNPYYTTDIRSDAEDVVEWVLRVVGDPSPANRSLAWNPLTLPMVPLGLARSTAWIAEIRIGVRPLMSSAPPATWLDMTDTNRIEFGVAQEVVIHAVMEGALDLLPPWVAGNYPADGAAGVIRTDSVLFNLLDDVSGVDPTSIFIQMTYDLNRDGTVDSTFNITSDVIRYPIPSGFHCKFEPEVMWPGTTEVCIAVSAQDLATPPHVMSPFEWCFITQATAPGDFWPPVVRAMTINPDIIDTVNALSSILFTVEDGGMSGVNDDSIRVIVDGVDRTSACSITRIGISRDYRVAVGPFPPGGWTQNTTHNIVIRACDLATPPNCALPYSVTFYVPPLDTLTAWVMAVSVNSSAGPSTILRFGMDPSATIGYDPGIDAPFPGAPGFYAYFPISDPAHPTVTKLSRDIRRLAYGSPEVWEARMNAASGSCSVTWDMAAVPRLVGCYMMDLYAGHSPVGAPPSSIVWTDMRFYSSMPISAEEAIYFKAMIRDTCRPGAPYITNLDPAAGAMNVPVSSLIRFDIRDDIGIDPSSIRVYLNAVDHTSYATLTELVSGYRVVLDPPGLLMPFMTYTVRVVATDLDAPDAHTLDTTYTFSTAGSCGPQFRLTITAIDSSLTGVLSYGVTLGTDSLATEDYDPGIDVITPPPLGFFAAIHNPNDPGWTNGYGTDIRNNCIVGSEWHIFIDRETAGARHRLQWNSALVPFDPNWKLKIAVSSGTRPPLSAFTDMRDINRVSMNPNDTAFVIMTTEGPPLYCLYGVVSNRVTGAPISGAQLAIGTAVFTTNPAGEYEICGLLEGNYEIRVSATGYYDTTIVVAIHDTTMLNIQLQPVCYMVTGTASLDGTPTAGISILFGTVAVVSGAGGAYSVCLPAGTYPVHAEYMYRVFDGNITVTGAMTYNINLVTTPVTIRGTVVLLPGATPAAGAVVYIDGTPVTADGSGSYSRSVTPFVGHSVRATYPGYRDSMVFLATVVGDTTVNFGLVRRPLRVCFNVNLEESADESGAIVSMPPLGTRGTNAAGLACFDSVPAGSYNVNITKSCHADVNINIAVTNDTTISTVLPFYWCVPMLTATPGPDLVRPLDADLRVQLTWTAPTSSYLTVGGYRVYRDGTLLTTTTSTTYDDDDVADGETHIYTVVPVYTDGGTGCTCPTAEVTISVAEDPSSILLIDFDNGHGYAEDLEVVLGSILTPADRYTRTAQDENITGGRYSLADYEAVIVVLGVRGGTDTPMPPAMVNMLASYGGWIYVEGPDFAQDYAGTGFLANFRFSAVDGYPSSTGNVRFVKMDYPFFHDRWTMDYPYQTEPDHYVDRLTPNVGCSPILYANDDSVVVGVHAGSRFYTSIFITELSRTGSNAPARILGGLLWSASIPNTGIFENPYAKPTKFSLTTSPNPFNAACDITIDLPTAGNVELSVYDLCGAKVATLHNGMLNRGSYTITWNADGCGSGIYLVQMKVGEYTATARAILIK